MSLSLLQGYSSAEEEEEDHPGEEEPSDSYRSSSDGGAASSPRRGPRERSIFDHPKPSRDSLLPSAFDVFSEVAGPPEFLNNAVAGSEAGDSKEGERRWRGRGGKAGREAKDLPAGVVVEAKAQLVGIRDRVRSDVGGSDLPSSSGKSSNAGPRLISATNPDTKEAADLLRMCVQCGIPKTYSHNKGVVCPVCGDRPPPDPDSAADLLRMCVQCGIPKTYSHNKGVVCPVCGDRPPPDPDSAAEKKRGSTIKDKEKSKRMRGQSSHATWKSETEMHLRQQFD